MQKLFIFIGLMVSAQILSARELPQLQGVQDLAQREKILVEFMNQNRSVEKVQASLLPLLNLRDRKFVEEYIKENKVTALPETRLNGKVHEAYVGAKKIVTFEVLELEKDLFKINGYVVDFSNYKTAADEFKFIERVLKAHPLQVRNARSLILESAWADESYLEKWSTAWLYVKHHYSNQYGHLGGLEASKVLFAFDDISKKIGAKSGVPWTGIRIKCPSLKEKTVPVVYFSFLEPTQARSKEFEKKEVAEEVSKMRETELKNSIIGCCIHDAKNRGSQCEKLVNKNGGGQVEESSPVKKGTANSMTTH